MFGIAEWLVQNWWFLFHEVRRFESFSPRMLPGQHAWIQRHCLRAADSSLSLPSIVLFHDGRTLRADWMSDLPGSMPHYSVEFSDQGSTSLDAESTQDYLAEFVNDVLRRARNIQDGRVSALRQLWAAIRQADLEEQEFCKTSAKLGIDPYDSENMSGSLVQFIENELVDPDRPLVRDLIELPVVSEVKAQWDWVQALQVELHLDGYVRPERWDDDFLFTAIRADRQRVTMPEEGLSAAYAEAYDDAHRLRACLQIGDHDPIGSIDQIASRLPLRSLEVVTHNHVPGSGIRALLGQSNRKLVIASPRAVRSDSKRFLQARSLYQWFFSDRDSLRLVTDGYAWDQRASRAFAAELLAPQAALQARLTSNDATDADILNLSVEFQVSTEVIRRQLENAGVRILED